jgi:hypothetical protein
MMGSAFAATPATAAATTASALTKEQITTIQQSCSKTNGGSMTSEAYKTCVKAKEDEEVAKLAHKK